MKRILMVVIALTMVVLAAGCGKLPKDLRGEIAFTSSMDNDGAHDIYVISLPSKEIRQLTYTEGEDVENVWADWSSVGKIVFASTRDGNYEIYMLDSDDSGDVRLTKNDYFDGYPTMRWDGKVIAFASAPPPKRGRPQKDIYLMDVATRKIKRLTNTKEDEVSLRFSPDGKKLAYSKYVKGQSEIFVYDFETGRSTRLTNHPSEDINPAWTQDSRFIVFSSNRNDSLNVGDTKRYSIFVMNAEDGSDVTELVDEKYTVGGASVSPDTRWLVYHHMKRINWLDIAVRDLETGKTYTLVKNIFFNRDPVWNPTPPE